MKVKKYTGATMQDTIFKVKAELGSDAIILNTRKFKKGLLGLFGKTRVEVLAAQEDNDENEKTLNELKNLKNMINEMNQQWRVDSFARDLSGELASIYQHFNLQGVKSEFCQRIIGELSEENYPEGEIINKTGEKLREFLGDPLPISTAGSRRVVALVGPTGVGKTTTIAKLAASYTLDEEKKVGLVTADTYRIAAVQQLKTYSDIIDVPFQVVYNREELKKTLENKYVDYDLVFLDTAGSSWNDKMQLGRLKKLLSRDIVNEIHLIISVNTKSSDTEEIIDRFSILNPDRIILSKLDETMSFGNIINIKDKYNYPYSYITNGQDVPDDIQIADSDLLVNYIMGDLDG